MSSRMKNFDGSRLWWLGINEFRRNKHRCLCNSNFAKSWWFLLIPKLGRLSRRPLQLWYRKLVPQKLQFQDPLLNRIVFLPFWNCLNILECQISCWELLKLSGKVQRTKSVPLSEGRTFWLFVSGNIQFLEIEHILFSLEFWELRKENRVWARLCTPSKIRKTKFLNWFSDSKRFEVNRTACSW